MQSLLGPLLVMLEAASLTLLAFFFVALLFCIFMVVALLVSLLYPD